MQPFSLFFSGTEPDKYFNIIKDISPTMLISYQYAQKKGKKFLAKRTAECPELKLLVDSGAHTFLNDTDTYRSKDDAFWNDYLEGYVDFIRQNKEHIFAAAELDLDFIVGAEKVEEWREKYFIPLEKEGIQIIYVWHGSLGAKAWEEMCKRFSYVGYSYMDKGADLSDKNVNLMFVQARRHKAKVHGFGITGSIALAKFPFASTDSSSWLIGAQYGELNVFESGKLKRLKKDKWKTLYRNVLRTLGANMTLLDREDGYEIQRVCALSFIEMEKYVRRTMKSKWYWSDANVVIKKKILKKKVTAVEKPKEEPFFLQRGSLPNVEWFDGDQDNWQAYAEALGIDVRVGAEEAKSWISVFYDFINGNDEDREKYSAEICYDLCNDFGNKEVKTRFKAIQFLKTQFLAHAKGEIDVYGKLSEVAEGAEENSVPKPKERDNPLPREEAYVTEEVTQSYCNSLVAGFLTSSAMPEVEAYDEELRGKGIQVVRDEKGKFVKGYTVKRKPKKLISDYTTKFSCDNCAQAMGCYHYKAGYVCALNPEFNSFDSRNPEDYENYLQEMANYFIAASARAANLSEATGIADPNVAVYADQADKFVKRLKDFKVGSTVATQRTVMRENGTIESVTEVRSNPAEGSLLQRMFFSNMSSEPEKEPINVTPEGGDNNG